jgi:hypothetical protein
MVRMQRRGHTGLVMPNVRSPLILTTVEGSPMALREGVLVGGLLRDAFVPELPAEILARCQRLEVAIANKG